MYTPLEIFQPGGNISTLVEIFIPQLKYFQPGNKVVQMF